ncbi:MAG: CBS domain-containing protein [Planctomycetaceae bacterium]
MTVTAVPTAGEMMQTHVVSVSENDSLREALMLMTEHHVHGLPVTDAQDTVVGVITATDILQYEEEVVESTEGQPESLGSYFDPQNQSWETVRMLNDIDDLPSAKIRDVMSPDVISVTSDTDARVVARKMRCHDVHRVLVLNESRQLLGIISAFDFVKLFAT